MQTRTPSGTHGRTRVLRALAVGTLAVVLASCAAGPSVRPDVAVDRGVVDAPAPAEPEEPETEALPLEPPVTDLAWSDCTARITAQFGVTASPGTVVDCATYPAPIDASEPSSPTFELAATRVRTSTTPADAAPVVYTSGTDRPSTADIAAMAASPDTMFLDARPVVGVDRRGTGNSAPFDCYGGLTSTRNALADLGQFSAGGDPIEATAELGRNATVACTDFMGQDALSFEVTNSADDIEALRVAWGVRALSLIGSGNGALVALAYAGAHGDHLARMVLDSPTSVVTDAVSTEQHAVEGREAALTEFATRCAAAACSLGADPRAAVVDLFARADAGEFAPLSGATFRRAVTFALGYPAPGDPAQRTDALSTALSTAADGDTAALDGIAASAASIVDTDGVFVSRCTDGQQWPGPDRVRELQEQWASQYPAFGASAAVGLLACAAWPATAPPPLPSTLDVPVLVLSGDADPVTGNSALPAVTGAVGAAGSSTTTVTWAGIGHAVTLGSACGRTAVAGYLDTGDLPVGGNACPA